MPELAEVELARRIWAQAEGETIQKVLTHPQARIFRDQPARSLATLEGKEMVGSARHGKRMYFTFGNDLHLEVHLGMSGKVYLGAQDHGKQKHDHLILKTPQRSLVLNDYRMFGRVLLHEGEPPWASLPPDPLSRQFNAKRVLTITQAHPRRALKAALLNQDLFPGLGNWMVDEISWRLQVHPATPLSAIEPVALYREVKYVSKGAIKYVADKNASALTKPQELGFTAGGYVAEVPPASWLFQHRWKKGGCCPSCKSTLERDTIATRTTAWCPKCQKA